MSSHQPMTRISIAILLSLMLLLFSSGAAQRPEARQEEQLLALIKEVQAQQAQIADNQAKIDSKLAEVAETIRVARIYSKRGK
jgi:protein-disulfide isomerase